MRTLTPDDLQAVWSLLPYTAIELVGFIGPEAACKLLNERPGVEFMVPKHPNANADGARRWAEIAEIIGEPEMVKLAALMGGVALSIPTCKDVRGELRRRSIRAMFDRLTTGASKLSARKAIYEICLAHAPINARAVEKILSRADAGEPSAQAELF